MKRSTPKLTLTETAKYLGVSRPRVFHMMERGQLTKGWMDRPVTITKGPSKILGFDKKEVEERKKLLDSIESTQKNTDDLLTLFAAADILGVTKQRAQQLSATKRIKSISIGHRLFVTRDSVLQYKKERDAALAELSV